MSFDFSDLVVISINLSEKKCNPFLNQNCEMASELRSKNNYSDFDFFRYLRQEKDSF